MTKEQAGLSDRVIELPEYLETAIDQIVPDEATAIGFVACNQAGEFRLVEPANHFDHVSATFPKVQRQPDERPSQTLLRCLQEKIGAQPETVYPLHQLWGTQRSQSMFFAGLVTEPGHPTSPYVAGAEWHAVEEAQRFLRTSENLTSRQRDLEVLDAATQLCLTPERRLLLAVQELHEMGFECLRIMPYLAPSGAYWRCRLVPKSCISNQHGAIADDEKLYRLMKLVDPDGLEVQHSSGNQQRIFGWEDSCFDSPKELAFKYLERFRELIFASWGEDSEYVLWYEKMLSMTAPYGLVFAMADWDVPADRLPTMNTIGEVTVPLPPCQSKAFRRRDWPLDEQKILTCCALRFDGYKYRQDNPAFLPHQAVDTFLATGRWDASETELWASFFFLQRSLGKWDLVYEPTDGSYWQAFRSLFLRLSRVEVPVAYQDREYNQQWENQYRPQLAGCIALIQTAFDRKT